MVKLASLGNGMVTDRRTKAMLDEAARRSGLRLQYAQGSYRHGMTKASGSTHDGGGVVDVRTVPLRNRREKMRLVRALRLVGFAAWYREATPGLWGEHIHAVAIACPDLSDSAARQVVQYRNGTNGLNDHGRDPQADLDVAPRTWEAYQRRWPLITARTGARVFDVPGGKRVGRRRRGVRVHVLDRRVRGGVVWLRIRAGWIRARRTSRPT